MTRDDVLRWLREHPMAVHGDPDEILERCERAVRRHAAEDAWLAAKQYAEHRAHDYQTEGWGAHASETFVAREVCHRLAWELRRHEPEPSAGDEEHLAGGPVKEAVEPEAWNVLCDWILGVARQQEHETWHQIVRFTGRRARKLIRERRLSDDSTLEGSRHYPEIAADVASMLAHDYSLQAHPR